MDILDSLKQEVFSRRSGLLEVYNQSGRLSLYDYVQTWQIAGLGGELGRAVNIIEGLLLNVYPKEVALEAAAQLRQLPLVSTIDHHGILNHPFFLNSNLIFSQRQGLKYLICLSTAGVSLNNSSWPGCLLFTSKSSELKRLSFFPDSLKNHPVLSVRALNKEDVERVFLKLKNHPDLILSQKQELERLIEEVFLQKNVLNRKNFSEQACLVSGRLWQKVFPAAPKIIYMPLEQVVSQIILELIVPEPSHILHKLFFSKQGQSLLHKYFFGLDGAFGAERGSFLFWQIDQAGHRVALKEQQEVLLDANWVKENLEETKLYATSLACFLCLLYYGLTALGGFNQVHWLGNIKQKFGDLLKEEGLEGLAAKILATPTNNFAEGNLAFINKHGQPVKATLLDCLLNGQDQFAKAQELSKKITLGNSIESLLPEIYRVVVPAGQRKGELLTLTDLDIINPKTLGFLD